MKREITTEKTVETTKEITICDRCGLESDAPHNLFGRGQLREKFKEEAESHHRIEPGIQTRSRQEAYTVTMHEIERLFSIAISYCDAVTVCGDCYDEMFGWIE